MGLLDDLNALQQQFATTEEDKKAARNQALMAFGLGLMGAPKGQEWNRVGLSGMNAMNGYYDSIHNQQLAKMQQMQAASGALDLRQKLQGAQDADAFRKASMDYYGGQIPGQPSAPSGPSPMPPQGMSDRGLGTTPAAPAGAAPAAPAGTMAAPTKQSKFEQLSQFAQYLASRGLTAQAQQVADQAEKFRPKLKEQQTLTDPASGQRIRVNVYEDGSIERLPLGPDQEKAHFLDQGGKIAAVDPFTGNVVKGGAIYDKSVSPDAALSSATSLKVAGMNDARQRELNALTREQGQWETNLDRGIQINKVTGATRPITSEGQPVGNALDQKRKQAGQTVNDILDVAQPLVEKATNSYAGTAYDKAVGAFGHSTDGATATAQLKALEGQLMLAQPRMEGPQSDKDTALYKQMAANLGDPTVPREQKLAAMETIRQIYAKYGDGKTAQPVTSGQVATKVKAAGYAYEPAKYEYRVLPDGTVQRRPK